MSAVRQLNTQHPHPQEQRPELHVHQPSQAKTSEDVLLASMFLACAAFALAFAGLVVVPYMGQWLAL